MRGLLRTSYNSLIILSICGLLTQASAADVVESVEALIRQGVELRHQSHDERALPLFQKAYGLTRTPRTAGQLGLSEMAMGYWLDAERHLSEALGFPEHPWVAKNHQNLAGALESVRTNISDVVVDGEPANAEVFVNGLTVGRLPLAKPMRLGKGAIDIELRSPGYLTASRSLRVGGGAQERVTIVLERSPPAAIAAPVGTQQPATAIGQSDRVAGAETPEIQSRPVGSPRRIAAWTTAGVAGAAFVFGVVETFAWASKQDQFDNHQGPLPSDPTMAGRNCGSAEKNYGGQGCLGLHDQVAGARTRAIVGYGAAAALGVASAILFATSSNARSRTDTAFTCAPDLASRGMGCRFSF